MWLVRTPTIKYGNLSGSPDNGTPDAGNLIGAAACVHYTVLTIRQLVLCVECGKYKTGVAEGYTVYVLVVAVINAGLQVHFAGYGSR
jgi:hypothetical protein